MIYRSDNSFVRWALSQPDPYAVLSADNFHTEAAAFLRGDLRGSRPVDCLDQLPRCQDLDRVRGDRC